MVALDLSSHGKQFSIFVPDTTTEKLEVVEQSWGALEIKVGKNHVNFTVITLFRHQKLDHFWKFKIVKIQMVLKFFIT